MKFKLHEFSNSTNEIKGTIGNYVFSAKHYDEPSRYGIERGRVSKLSMYLDNRLMVDYDREWINEPIGGEVIAAYDELMARLENLPERFNSMELDVIKAMEEENKWYNKMKERVSEFTDSIESWFER